MVRYRAWPSHRPTRRDSTGKLADEKSVLNANNLRKSTWIFFIQLPMQYKAQQASLCFSLVFNCPFLHSPRLCSFFFPWSEYTFPKLAISLSFYQGVRYFAAADNRGVFVTESKVTKMSNSNNGNSESATAPPEPALAEVRRTPASSRPASATVRRSETMRSSRQQLRLQAWDSPIECFKCKVNQTFPVSM